jgi:hypothetical protein
MTTHRRLLAAGLVLLLGIAVGLSRFGVRAAESLPSRLTDQEFWRLNLLSNEIWLQWVIPDLTQRARQGGVYVGVGPEQNYAYIAALKPKMAFLPDIRRGNLDLQLMYKALFEMSADRADFVSRLFSKNRPAGLSTKSTALDIFNAYETVETNSEDVYRQNLKAIDDELTGKNHLPLPKEDLGGIEYVYYNFYWFGPSINYNSSTSNGGRSGNFATYADLMVATDEAGVSRSFLASEDNFKVLKDLEERNLMVPVVGNLAGPKAVRAIGKYTKDHGATITAFYLSNVEQYLQRDGSFGAFLCNVRTMPLDAQSTFIRSQNGGGPGFGGGSVGVRGLGGRGGGLKSYLGTMQEDAKGCAGPGR